MSETEIKRQVREFYDQVGWQTESDGFYQNARYEDLRTVSREYIHRCHIRVNRHLKREGKYLLDAGSGPVQYPEYLTYSEGYSYRVCADISIVALKEARLRLGEKGLYVVMDVAHLPFARDVFEGVVSLHTLHHLPLDEQASAYEELHRVLKPGCSAVVVNGWTVSGLMRRADWFIRVSERIRHWRKPKEATEVTADAKPSGTFVNKNTPAWLKNALKGKMDFEIFVWRSVSMRFLRALVFRRLGGRYWLRLLYWMEERRPHWFGEKGQYPLVVIRKPAAAPVPLSEDGGLENQS
jgi:SAM-dependent methyltransferase